MSAAPPPILEVRGLAIALPAGGERSHAATAFHALVEEKKKA